MGGKPRILPKALCECGHTKAEHNRLVVAQTAAGPMRRSGCCNYTRREVAAEGDVFSEFCICVKFKLTKYRPFTPQEIIALESLVLRCFTGRGNDADATLAGKLIEVNPNQYGSISRKIRREEIARLRSW